MRLRTRRGRGASPRAADGDDEAERYDLLLELATDAAYAARWPDVEEAAFEAMALGRRARLPGAGRPGGRGAHALLRVAAARPGRGASRTPIDDLRWALATCRDDDVATRCRLQLALAVELYYAPDAARRAAGARRHRAGPGPRVGRPGAAVVGEPRGLDGLVGARGTRRTRASWAAEGLAAAREAGDHAAAAVLLVTLALDALELGAPRGLDDAHRGGRARSPSGSGSRTCCSRCTGCG